MVNYQPINAHIKSRSILLRIGLASSIALTAIVLLLLLTFTLFLHTKQNKYPSFSNDIADWWTERTIIYAEAIHSNSNLTHDYRLHKNSTNWQLNQNSNESTQPVRQGAEVTSRIVCYYNSPNTADKYQRLHLTDVDPHLCTHIHIGDIEVENSSLVLTPQLETIFEQELPLLRAKNPELKFLLWVGGGATSKGFPHMVKNHSSRKLFIQSLKHVLRKHGLDGVDLDWEFPSAYAKERQHFSQLLHEIKAEYAREHKPYLLSVAVAAPEGIALFAYDVRELNTYADYVSIMTYDYHFFSRHTPFTGLNAPLYARKNDHSILATLNINYSVHWWLNNGLAPQKLIVGLPTYGHSFTLVNLFNNRIGAPAAGFGRTGKAGFTAFSELCWFQDNNFVVSEYYDEESCSPYLSCGDEWISYENAKSLECKANYIKSNNLGGAMVFSLNTDDYLSICKSRQTKAAQSYEEANENANFPLTRQIKNILIKY